MLAFDMIDDSSHKFDCKYDHTCHKFVHEQTHNGSHVSKVGSHLSLLHWLLKSWNVVAMETSRKMFTAVHGCERLYMTVHVCAGRV